MNENIDKKESNFIIMSENFIINIQSISNKLKNLNKYKKSTLYKLDISELIYYFLMKPAKPASIYTNNGLFV